ncbi:FERM domain-containing protein 4B, partial [Armadillidium nasatum]
FQGAIEVNAETAVKLAALSLQIAIGDFVCDSVSRNFLRASSFSTYSNPLEHSQLYLCEDRVCGEHQQLIGLSRGDAILSYMRQIESIPGYGVHFYEVRDRANLPYYLGISRKGIAQYEFRNKSKPSRVFFWKQLENLYFRERKFSIEVHDPKRVVSALNSFNLYERAIQDSDFQDKLLLQAISEETTQLSLSSASVLDSTLEIPWYTVQNSTHPEINYSLLTTISRFQSRAAHSVLVTLVSTFGSPKVNLCARVFGPWRLRSTSFTWTARPLGSRKVVRKVGLEATDLVGELSRSCISLSTHSSSPNLSRSGSHSSLQHHSHTEESASTESLHAARMEMLSALQQRLEGLQEKLDEKTEELKLLCLREGELTGELPPEYPLKPGEPPPVVRKRVGTSFLLDETLISKIINKQEETVASLELEYEIQAKIVSAALRIANESSLKKGLRKQRKNSYHQATQRLKTIEQRLQQAKTRQAQVLANNASTMPKMKKKPRPVSDGEAVVQDDSCISLGNHKEASFVEAFSLSQTTNIPPLSKSKTGGTGVSLHSAPPSPQRSSSGGAGTPSESSSQLSGNKSSRSNSPARPSSGYIPSVVYTRNQYRTQHYPTLSTRGQSVPCESLEHQRSFTGGLYNLPHQRTSLASHSLDDLDTSTPNNSPIVNPVKNPSLVHLPPHPHTINYQYTPHHHHFKHHHHHPNHHPARRPRNSNESSDRFGSLDRRRANSGRYESRSMEHLDSLPPYPSESPSPVSSPAPQPSASNNHVLNDFTSLPNTEHQETHVWTNHLVTQDSVDGISPSEYPHDITAGNPSPHFRDQLDKDSGDSISSRGLVRSASGRSYAASVDVNYASQVNGGNARNYSQSIETPLHHETQSFSVNQENIPPGTFQSTTAETLIPLRASNPQRGHSKREGYATNLRSTASVNAADHLRPFRFATNELPPLRPTKSSCDLPPLKPTNGRHWDGTPQSPLSYPSPSIRSYDDYNNRIINGTVEEEPLISLAEGARLRKEQREKEWYEASAEENSKPKMQTEQNKAQISVHNLSTSSIGSSESSGSVFQSVNDGNESLNTTLNNSLSTSLNATLTVISAGSYQPSREVTKPFEMSDFYKYSTKFRRKSSSSGGQYESGGHDSPICNNTLSPTLPPRASQVTTHVNSPSNSPAEYSIPPTPSPSLVAQQSSPAPQQKGKYQPLTPLTCKPLEDESSCESPGCEILSPSVTTRHKQWETTPVHQAVPVNITTKRSATLV